MKSATVYCPLFSDLITLKGTSKEMGWQLGTRTGRGIRATFEWTILSCMLFLDQKEGIRLLKDSKGLCIVFRVCQWIGEWLFDHLFVHSIPGFYLEEIKGILEATNDHLEWEVNRGTLTIINFWLDFLNVTQQDVKAFGVWSDILDLLSSCSDHRKESIQYFRQHFNKTFRFQLRDACDAVSTQTQEGPCFVRYFQFPSIHYLFPNISFACQRYPTDHGRLPTIGLGLPGFIGVYAGMNRAGVATGFNYFRSCAVSPGLSVRSLDQVGIPITIQLRYMLDWAQNSDHGVELLAYLVRGCPYLVMIADRRGPPATQCLELLGRNYSLTSVDPWLRVFTPVIHNNMIMRQPKSCIWNYLNPAPLPLPQETFATWQQEQSSLTTLGNNYFIRVQDDWSTKTGFAVMTNNALTPLGRSTMMTRHQNAITSEAEAPTWRYQFWCRQLSRPLSLDNLLHATAYLAPCYVPDYPANRYYTNLPLPPDEIPIQCAIAVFRTDQRMMYLRLGKWKNPWIMYRLD